MAGVSIGRAVSILVIILVAVLFGLIYSSYQRDIRQARERVSTGSQIVQTPCGPVEYAMAGDGPPVLVVHGAGGYDQGLDFGGPLAKIGFRIIAVSRFGYLRTSLPAAASAAAQADDLFGTFDGARYTAEHVPHARFIGYQSGGHLWVGYQKDVIAEIAVFLK